ncbi:MAG: CGNR zinc finger domain-containing protein [Romboutsia sp.]
MKDINLIGQFKTDWIKYSDYEVKVNEDGKEYISPTKEATFIIYNPFDVATDLLFDLIKLGDLTMDKSINDNILKLETIEFVKRYGLLGLVTSSVYNRNVVGEEKVIFMDNNFITKSKIMDVEKYLKLFLPFAKEDEVHIRQLGKHIVVSKAEDSPKFYGKRPLVLDIVFSKFYCEDIKWILAFAKNISTHINQLLIYKNIKLTESVTIMANQFKAEKIGFTISMLTKPYIEWEFDSLKTAIETVYAFGVTDENRTISRCEYCNKAYIAKTEREKYCNPSCRNCSNVIKSRNKKRALENSIDNEVDEI